MPASSIFRETWLGAFLTADIGLRQADGEAHYPNHMWLQSVSYMRGHMRIQGCWAPGFQGVNAGIVASLERWGAVVHTQDPETTIEPSGNLYLHLWPRGLCQQLSDAIL